MLKEGILGIGETDETENEEGSEIELTAYNPDFDEPQLTDEEKLQIESEEENPRIDLFSSTPLDELTDGVSTLFMKKGGRVPFQGGGRDASQADFGGSTSGGTTGGGNDRPNMADIAGPTTTTSTTAPEAPDTGGHSRFDVGSGYYGEPTTTSDTDGWSGDYEEPYLSPQDKYNIQKRIADKYNKQDSFWEKGKKAIGLYQSLPKPTGVPLVDVLSFGYFAYKQNEKKKEKIADIDADLELLDKIGATKYTPHTDTLYQKLEQKKLDLTQPRSRDEDTKGDGPEAPVVAPVTEEIEDSYAQATGFLQGYRDLKAKQALSAQLQQKWADERQWQQETLFANSGGLANLFRVKN